MKNSTKAIVATGYVLIVFTLAYLSHKG